MTEPPQPPTPPGPPGGAPPSPPPPSPPPGGGAPPDSPPPGAPEPAGSGASSTGPVDDRSLMIMLSYLYPLCFVPLLMQKDDAEIQWHAKQGTVLMGLDFLLAIVLGALTFTGLGCLLLPVYLLVVIGFLVLFVVRILAAVKGVQGDRFVIPGVSKLAESF